MMYRLLEKFNLKIGYRHWYQVTYTYKDKSGRVIFTLDSLIGITNKANIRSPRFLKRISPVHKIKGIQKGLLCNGILNIKVDCYLGWLQSKP